MSSVNRSLVDCGCAKRFDKMHSCFRLATVAVPRKSLSSCSSKWTARTILFVSLIASVFFQWSISNAFREKARQSRTAIKVRRAGAEDCVPLSVRTAKQMRKNLWLDVWMSFAQA